MTPLTDLLKQISDRADKATEGPWRPYVRSGIPGEYFITSEIHDDDFPNIVHEVYEWRNTNFIAHARTDVPRLVKALAWCLDELGMYQGSKSLNESREIVTKILSGEEQESE